MSGTSSTVTLDLSDDDRYAVLVNALDAYADELERQLQREEDADRFEHRDGDSPLTQIQRQQIEIARELRQQIEEQLGG